MGHISRSRECTRRNKLQNSPVASEVESLENRRVPTMVVDLPVGVGPFELSRQDNEMIIRQQDGTELFHLPLTQTLRINGTAEAETLVVNLNGGLPMKTVIFNARGGRDTLQLVGNRADTVNYGFDTAKSGDIGLRDRNNLSINKTIKFVGVESCDEELTGVHDRSFQFRGVTGAGITIADDGLDGNGLSQLTSRASPTVKFTDSMSLIFNLTGGHDRLVASRMDTGFSSLQGIRVACGDGNDAINVQQSGLAAWLDGGSGNDTLVGSIRADALWGGDGNDTLRGSDGDDYLVGSSGDDFVVGGNGNDTFEVNSGADTLKGQGGDDGFLLHLETQGTEVGTPTLSGGEGIDTVRGFLRDAASVILTDSELRKTASAVTRTYRFQNIERIHLSGHPAANLQSGALLIDASATTTGVTLEGGIHNDTLIGGLGDDLLVGNAGDDSLQGGPGVNVLQQ